MINVNVFDINNPVCAKLTEQMERQAKAYESLQGGAHAMMGNAWDPWNVMGISWKLYQQYKTERGYTDEEIADTIKFSKSFPELDKLKARVENYKLMM